MFKEFDLPILFDISTTKSVDKNKLDFVDDGEYDFIGRTSVDWGIQGKLHKLSFEPNPKESFSLIQVGETVALWREREWYASQNLFLLNPKIDEIKESKLYFQGAINKEMSRYGKEYNSYPTMKSLTVTKIVLPVIESSEADHEYTVDDIDWEYMRDRITELERDRITELERDRITELEGYLQATGLNDYELTEADVRYEKFVIGEIFNSHNGDNNLRKADVNGKGVHIITAGVKNNGILGLSDKGAKVINENTITVDLFGNTYFRDFNYKMTRSVCSLELKEGALSEGAGIYICSELKQLSELFNYDNMCSFNKIKSLSIELPIKSDGTPDFDYMERYIRAIEKVVIVDVMKYKDKVIETTKKVVDG